MLLNPFLAEFRTNPYPAYKMLREADRVMWQEMMQAWLVTGYDEVEAVLKDHGRFSSERQRAANRMVAQLMDQQDQGIMRRTATMLSADPPNHTRMRTLVNKAFTPRAVEQMRPHIQEIADELLDAIPDPTSFDIVKDLAVPLPIIVIAEMLGVSPSDREQFKAWSTDIASVLGSSGQPQEVLQRAQQSSQELSAYFAGIIAERRAEPREDLISALIAARDQGDRLTEDELLATCVLLLVAGNETTTNLIGNGMLALMRNPDQRRELQEDPSIIASAVEELLRYDGPVQATSRVALQDLEFAGKQIKQGQIVITFLGAANHDPKQFSDPERLDLRRPDNHHMAFGHGIHYCLGAPLARVEGQIAISTLLRRFPDIEPDFEQPEWGSSFILRGLKSLPVHSRRATKAR
ncbi:MAG TPA: cytochrome P450 [Dehalococcoidia bacterium]|nr:cytochrome P450 [Dehalococcoidia bacterium]